MEGKEREKNEDLREPTDPITSDGKKKEFFDFVKIKGKIYKVSIQPYVPLEDLFKRAVNSGVFTADELKKEA